MSDPKHLPISSALSERHRSALPAEQREQQPQLPLLPRRDDYVSMIIRIICPKRRWIRKAERDTSLSEFGHEAR
jgi:hypothetical protein